MSILSLQNVSKDYLSDGQRVEALKGLSLEANRGNICSARGTKRLREVHAAESCRAMDFLPRARLLVEGISTSSLNDAALTRLRREKVGFIFQSFQLLHTLTVFENVELPLLLAGKPRARAAAQERLEWVELKGLGDRYPHQLSGGQISA